MDAKDFKFSERWLLEVAKEDEPLGVGGGEPVEAVSTTPRFAETFCSQCGTALGPGNSGVSHCADHETKKERDKLIDFVTAVLQDEDKFGSLTCGTTKAPNGWHCTRELGHSGPCAAKVSTPLPQQDTQKYLKCTTCGKDCIQLRSIPSGSNLCAACFNAWAKPPALPQQEEPALENCPFCGKCDLKVIRLLSEDAPHREYARAVMCNDCHARGRSCYRIGWTESDRAAREAWNDRPEPIAPLLEQEEPPNQWRRLDSEKVVLKTQLAQALTSLAAAKSEIAELKAVVEGIERCALEDIVDE